MTLQGRGRRLDLAKRDAAAELRRACWPLRTIGKRLGVSTARAAQLLEALTGDQLERHGRRPGRQKKGCCD